MKNLKINNGLFKRITSFGLACVLAGSFTGCSSDKKDKEDESKEVLTTVVADNKMILVSSLKLKDTKTNEVLDNETIDAILVGNKLDREFDLIEVVFNKSVKTILVNDELVPVDRLVLVNSKNNEEIDELDYALVADELIPMDKYIKGIRSVDSNDSCEVEKSTEETVAEEEVYEELTDEKFYALADDIYKKYDEIGLDVSREEVIDYVMMRNIEKLSVDNKELITTIIGDRNPETAILNMNDVFSAIKTKNDYNYCSKGLGWDSLILVSDSVFDKETKEKVVAFENRVKEIFEAADSRNKDELDILFNQLYLDVTDATKEEFNMEYGAGYGCMNILIYFIRSNFESLLNERNRDYIKYLCHYATEFGTDYYSNSRASAYYSGMYYLLTDTLTCGKTRTK